MRTIVYARLSRLTDQNELNIGDQIARCREYATARGWVIVDEIIDAGVSAYDRDQLDDRPGFGQLLETVRAGQVDVVLAWRPDRLWRDPVEAAVFLRAAARSGVRSVATVVEGERDPANPGDELVTSIVAAVGRYESSAKSARLKAKARQLAELGKNGGGGTRPFGFEPDRVTIRADEADAIRRAAVVFVSTRNTHAAIRSIERSGFPISVTGKPWRPGTVSRILTSPRNAGLREHRGVIVGRAVWPAILDEALWRQVCDIYADPDRNLRVLSRSYLLTGGLACCGLCGGRLHARPRSGGDRCYVCPTGAAFDGCGKIRRLADPVEREVRDRVLAAISTARLSSPTTPDPGPLLADLAAVEDRLAQLARDHYVDGIIARAEYFAARTPLTSRVEHLRAEIGGQATTPRVDLVDLANRWEDLEVAEQRSVISAFVDKVIIHPAVRGLNRFDPTKIELIWRG